MKRVKFAGNLDPDEEAHHDEPPHLDMQCMLSDI